MSPSSLIRQPSPHRALAVDEHAGVTARPQHRLLQHVLSSTSVAGCAGAPRDKPECRLNTRVTVSGLLDARSRTAIRLSRLRAQPHVWWSHLSAVAFGRVAERGHVDQGPHPFGAQDQLGQWESELDMTPPLGVVRFLYYCLHGREGCEVRRIAEEVRINPDSLTPRRRPLCSRDGTAAPTTRPRQRRAAAVGATRDRGRSRRGCDLPRSRHRGPRGPRLAAAASRARTSCAGGPTGRLGPHVRRCRRPPARKGGTGVPRP
jgi:hypothetical protein